MKPRRFASIAIALLLTAPAQAATFKLKITKAFMHDCYQYGQSSMTCTFKIKIHNIGNAAFSGPIMFKDTISPSAGLWFQNYTITSVNHTLGCSPLSSSLPGTGYQTLNCNVAATTIQPQDHITITLVAKIVGPIRVNQNCATITLPVANPQSTDCVPI